MSKFADCVLRRLNVPELRRWGQLPSGGYGSKYGSPPDALLPASAAPDPRSASRPPLRRRQRWPPLPEAVQQPGGATQAPSSKVRGYIGLAPPAVSAGAEAGTPSPPPPTKKSAKSDKQKIDSSFCIPIALSVFRDSLRTGREKHRNKIMEHQTKKDSLAHSMLFVPVPLKVKHRLMKNKAVSFYTRFRIFPVFLSIKT